MNEILEAEIFNKELDKLLAGEKAGEGVDEELAKDLAMAQSLLISDMSRQSRVKSDLKAKLLSRGEASRPAGVFSWIPSRWVVMAPAAGLAVLLIGFIMVPKFASLVRMSQEGGGSGAFREGWGFRDQSGEFGKAGSPYSGSGAEMTKKIRSRMPSGALEHLKMASAKAGREMNRGGSAAGNLQTAGQAGRKGLGSVEMRPMEIASFRKLFWTEGEVMQQLQGAVAPASPMPTKDEMVQREFYREGYDHIVENAFQRVTDHPLSTFSIDVDAASYANARRFLNQSQMPPPDAVRIEEFINYFDYDYPQPKGEYPFSITTEVAESPWKTGHKLVHIGIQGKSIPKESLPPSNLVFLIDSSGSMASRNKLGLLKRALRLLVRELRHEDRIAIVTYAGSAGLVLPTTRGSEKAEILAALEKLQAGGSTAGGAGIELAYKVAAKNFMKKGNNRVILATDGDFNVGITSDGDLVRMIEKKREQGIFLTVLGFGVGNYQDAKMEKLADKGNGNYAYIDSIMEANKVLVKEMGGTLFTIAKDVKIQVEFNPARVQAYRLIGYENRALKAEDFNDDKKDAGELGAGHSVTALYEVIPVGVEMDLPKVDALKYQKTRQAGTASDSGELLTVKFRYKKPKGDKSRLIVKTLEGGGGDWREASQNFRFSAAVAGFGMLLRGSKHSGDLSYAKVRRMAEGARGKDEGGYRAEFLRLVEMARLLDDKR